MKPTRLPSPTTVHTIQHWLASFLSDLVVVTNSTLPTEHAPATPERPFLVTQHAAIRLLLRRLQDEGLAASPLPDPQGSLGPYPVLRVLLPVGPVHCRPFLPHQGPQVWPTGDAHPQILDLPVPPSDANAPQLWRLTPTACVTFDGHTYARHTRWGSFRRNVATNAARRQLLTYVFGLSPTTAERTASWWSEEPNEDRDGGSAVSPTCPTGASVRPPKSGVHAPDLLISCATIGRPESLDRLLRSLDDEIVRCAYPGQVGVLILNNESSPRPFKRIQHGHVTAIHVDIRTVREHLARSEKAGVLPPAPTAPPFSIGHAREAQVATIRHHLTHPFPGLPHPDTSPTVVWMVDDDVAFSLPYELVSGHVDPGPLWRAARYAATLPAHGVILGTFVGDPPIPGPDSWGGQLRDIAASLDHMLALGPDQPWCPPVPVRSPDDYYDLSECAIRTSEPHFFTPGSPMSVREAAVRMLTDVPRLLDGQQLTRPLIWNGEQPPPRPSLRRGGNALFLDIDALFRWPTPVHQGTDGVCSRRSDTLWATLAQLESPGTVVEVPLPLLHGRAGQARPGRHTPDGSTLTEHATAQLRGIAMSRALLKDVPVEQEMKTRREKIKMQRSAVEELALLVLSHLTELHDWHDAEVDSRLPTALDAIQDLRRRAALSVPSEDHDKTLQTFVDRLPNAVTSWRELW